MMLIHLIVGGAVVILTLAAGVVFLTGRPARSLAPLAGWTLGLLVIQAATGMFLLTAGEGGPGPFHIVLPLIGLAAVGFARLVRPEGVEHQSALVAAVYWFAAGGALVALVTGLTA